MATVIEFPHGALLDADEQLYSLDELRALHMVAEHLRVVGEMLPESSEVGRELLCWSDDLRVTVGDAPLRLPSWASAPVTTAARPILDGDDVER